MTDTNPKYKRLAKYLNKTRKTLSEVCVDLDIDIDTIEDEVLDRHTQECSHCGIWGHDHREDSDAFPVCKLCFSLVGR
jgi:hypothetical protein